METKKYEYRVQSMHSDGSEKYHIERREIGKEKWKLLFGGITREYAYELVKKPSDIESINKFFKWVGIGILMFMIFAVIVIALNQFEIL